MSKIKASTTSTTAYQVEADTTGTLVFQTGATPTTALTIDGSQNLGVGVSASAWGSGWTGLQFGPSGSVSNNGTGTPVTVVSNNAYYNGTNWIYLNSGPASQYQLSTSQHIWRYAASSSGTITWSEAMRLDASGNLGIGNTAPSVSSTAARTLVLGGAATTEVRLQNTGSGTTNIDGASFQLWNDGNVYLWNYENSATIFGTNGTERARINSSGYFKASNTGTYASASGSYHELLSSSDRCFQFRNTSTSGTLDSYIEFSAYAPNNTTSIFFACNDSSASRFAIRSNGGIANYSANNVNLSDRREKTNFTPAKSYLDVICAIPVQTYNYIDQNMEEDDGLTLGVVAQDVQAVAPELVTESNWGTEDEPKMRLSIYQTDMQYALMKCIQEQQAIITQLQADVAALKGAA